MENFFSYISKPVSVDDIKLWIDTNNICLLKMELYYDFVDSLIDLMYTTYLGGENGVKINMDIEDDIKHFDWCWSKTIENFRKESINFEPEGEHYEFFKNFFIETYYKQTLSDVKYSLHHFFDEIFNLDSTSTMSDLDLLITIYKNMEKNTINNLLSVS